MIEKINLGKRFKDFSVLDFEKETNTLSFTQKIITQIIKKEDENFKSSMIESLAKYCNEKGECIDLILIDEETAKEIIELGLECYIKKKAGE